MPKKTATATERFWKSLISQLPCVIARPVPGLCEGRVELHHVAEGSGLRSTFAMVPLCEGHHVGSAGLHPTVGGRGPKEFIRLYRPPGDNEYGLLVWMLEDLSNLLRGAGSTRGTAVNNDPRREEIRWTQENNYPHGCGDVAEGSLCAQELNGICKRKTCGYYNLTAATGKRQSP